MANTLLYGFHSLADVLGQRVTEVGVEEVGRAITESVAVHNQVVRDLFNLFVEPTTEFKTRYKTPNVVSLQPLDEYGRARQIQVAGYYEVSYPIQSAGLAWGRTRMATLFMTVEEANRVLTTILDADLRWMRNHLLAALLGNADWNFDDEAHGTLAVKPLANADATSYLLRNGGETGSTDSHYFAQAAGIADASNPYQVAADSLREHPGNDGEVVHLIAPNLEASTKALVSFIDKADPNVEQAVTGDRLIGSVGVNVPGELLGYDQASRSWVFKWSVLPDDYLVSTMTRAEKPLRMRQHALPELQGFHPVAERADHPFWEQQYERHAGFGAWNRVGAAVTRVGNAAYAIPAGYESPMA